MSPSEANAAGTPQSAPCRHLRHKGMLVFHDVNTLDAHDPNQGTIFWCQRSQKSFGPDNDLVDLEGCCDPSRRCFEEF
jgi:hypothetical protein